MVLYLLTTITIDLAGYNFQNYVHLMGKLLTLKVMKFAIRYKYSYQSIKSAYINIIFT